LEDIPGIGPGTAKKLLSRFGSLKGVKEASREALMSEVGEKKADLIISALAEA
jgi:excinuclease ABC subunit C